MTSFSKPRQKKIASLLLTFQIFQILTSANAAWGQAVPPPAPATAAPEFPSSAVRSEIGPANPPKKSKTDAARQGIPSAPSAPPALTPKKVDNVIRCQRSFMYRGKMLECDSNLEPDAERLRPIMSSVPAAVAELDNYQNTRQKVDQLGYVGGLGLGMIISGFILSRSTNSEQAARDYRTIGIGGGIIVLAVTLITGFTALNAASDHLGNAVKQYNQARPHDPIELQFSTGLEF